MVRAPCCEKMGLKKGPWTPEEDQILISYIEKHGHGNWRALPKQAGLLRCGKSCRLRWVNYLRPDIKRGNFTLDEEETIIKLHEMLGNRWSAIAARLEGRTDNEIKNVWHTHIKKKLKNHQSFSKDNKCNSIAMPSISEPMCSNTPIDYEQSGINSTDSSRNPSVSPQRSSSELSSVTDSSVMTTIDDMVVKNEEMDSTKYFPEIDESFWSEALSTDNSNNNTQSDLEGFNCFELQEQYQIPFANGLLEPADHEYSPSGSTNGGGMDFWYNVFVRAGNIPELPGF